MIMWLDHQLFGNGYGLASPYFDTRYYWLVDTSNGREKGRGELYHFMSGFGAQLESFQWRHPLPGETRRLCGREFVVFLSSREFLRVRVSWAMKHAPSDVGEKLTAIRALERDLNSALMEASNDKA